MTSIFDGGQIPLRQIPDIPSSVLSQPLSMIISMNSNGEIQEIPFTSDVTHGEELPGLEIYYHTSSILEEIPFIFIKTTGALPEAGIPHAGTFYVDILFLYIINVEPTADVSLTINFPNEITIPGKQLDDALIPDNIARLDDIPNFEAPVQSVNGKTGAVILNAADVGALPSTTVIPDALADLTADSTHRTVTDEEKATWNAKSNFSGNYNDLTNKPTIPSIAGLATETYVNNAVSGKVDKVSGKGLSTNDYTTAEKNKLAGIAEGAEVNQNAFAKVTVGSTTVTADTESDTLTLVAGSNVTITPDATNDKITIAATDTVYTHPTHTAKSSGLYKVTVDNEGHVSAATAVAKADITALGIPAQDTTYGAASTSANGLMTTTMVSKLNGIAAGAEVNQNAFSNIVVGSTTIAADAKTDSLTLVAGSNVTITPDATNDKITIAATDTTYSAASQSAAGLMSADDKKKLDGIATGANKITVDSALSTTSTNPVQNKVVNAAISNLNTLVGDTAVSTQISTAIAGLVDSSPDTLNTLNELAAALGDDPNFATTVATEIGKKVDKTTTINGKALSSNITLSASDVGVGYAVCNTEAEVKDLVATLSGYTLTNGGIVAVKFANDVPYAPYLNINNQGAKPVYYHGTWVPKYAIYAGDIATFIYANGVYNLLSIDNHIGIRVTSDEAITTRMAKKENDSYNFGKYSFTHGLNTAASGEASHAEGNETNASGNVSHAEGYRTTASGKASHAEGESTVAQGDFSHAEGGYTAANSKYSHVEGAYNIRDNSGTTTTRGTYVHIVGNGTANNARSNAHTLDWDGTAWYAGDVYVGSTSGTNKDAGSKKLATEEYTSNTANTVLTNANVYTDAEIAEWVGDKTVAEQIRVAIDSIDVEHPVRSVNTKTGDVVLTANDVGAMSATDPVGTGSFSMGRKADTTIGLSSHAEGNQTTASASYSHAEGNQTTASASAAHAEGILTTASGYNSHAEGSSTAASGENSHAEGYDTTASGGCSHAEGSSTEASGYNSHAEGNITIASGNYSHAEGRLTEAKGDCSHAEGINTKAFSDYQLVQGRYNIEDANNTYAHIVGGGIFNEERNGWNSRNINTLDWDGNAWFSGDVYVGSTSGKNKDEGSKKLATEDYVKEYATVITNAEIDAICGT